ncbi:hypothetical protein GCM10010185_45240 [Saccharothrix coeruleofusca]|uniref:HTH cro/C1-type domain-containing protein n=2 Tax=Saccharothrix coeruleofusca TaxID=33919 RepID=A0A918EFQ5_9PSEU|nr:hypothetical protein GCM10010185_45240 [Saccharothrix coeruleofusca]
MRGVQPEHIQIAATLRRMREQARVTREGAATVLGCTISKIGDLETGRSKPKPVELERLLDHYGVMGEERAELVRFARTSRRRRAPGPYTAATVPDNHRRIVDLEAQAVSSLRCSSEPVPGILQIRPYAEALLDWTWNGQRNEVAKLLDLRMERGKLLTRTHRPPLRYWCILSESALRTAIGGPKVMSEQLDHLIHFNSATENATIQVMPFDGGVHPRGVGGVRRGRQGRRLRRLSARPPGERRGARRAAHRPGTTWGRAAPGSSPGRTGCPTRPRRTPARRR